MPKRPSGALRPNGRPTRLRIKYPMINWRTHDLSAVDVVGDRSDIQELYTYQRNLDLLLERKGEYVLIKGDEIAGYYPDLDSALEDAAERFDTDPVLIKKIVEFEPIYPAIGLDL